MISRYDTQQFFIEPEHDGDFWVVQIYELKGEDSEKVLRYEYKLNHPKDEVGACDRAWELFRTRHLEGLKG